MSYRNLRVAAVGLTVALFSCISDYSSTYPNDEAQVKNVAPLSDADRDVFESILGLLARLDADRARSIIAHLSAHYTDDAEQGVVSQCTAALPWPATSQVVSSTIETEAETARRLRRGVLALYGHLANEYSTVHRDHPAQKALRHRTNGGDEYFDAGYGWGVVASAVKQQGVKAMPTSTLRRLVLGELSNTQAMAEKFSAIRQLLLEQEICAYILTNEPWVMGQAEAPSQQLMDALERTQTGRTYLTESLL